MATPPPSDCPTNVAPLVPQRQQQITHAARERSQRVVAAGLLRGAVADEVGRDDREALGERRAGRDRQVAELPAMPWMRTITGPDPRGAIPDPMAVDLDVAELEG